MAKGTRLVNNRCSRNHPTHVLESEVLALWKQTNKPTKNNIVRGRLSLPSMLTFPLGSSSLLSPLVPFLLFHDLDTISSKVGRNRELISVSFQEEGQSSLMDKVYEGMWFTQRAEESMESRLKMVMMIRDKQKTQHANHYLAFIVVLDILLYIINLILTKTVRHLLSFPLIK